MESFKRDQLIYKDGVFVKASEAGIDFFSQTIHYGFGAFEGLRSYQTGNGVKIFKAKEHFNRLKFSCAQINMPFNWDIDQLILDTYTLLERIGLTNAYIRPMVFAGADMSMISSKKAQLIITAWSWDAFYGDKFLKTCISKTEKPTPSSIPINAKITGNYINSVLAITDAKARGFDEAILVDVNGFISETTSANVYMEKGGKLYTPKADNVMPGITRATVMKIAEQLEIEVIEKDITVEEFKNADSAFACGTAVEIIGIKSVDECTYPLAFDLSLGANIQRVYKSLVLDKLSFEVII
ncbi:branched-chain amino acid aminotransferase [Pelobium manganitolerans]|uniref:branched-chain-amino-acid transaminase n=1 Tax=Pelobium manganitolerans TaxID=1842495 RepID=A0A419S9A1_9SPHI|nr:aminotransferase class IV [Pelobium manganitolerans]RKD18596.1 branched-chain amino acid aminotransferase [Pelobium manganitolerans]